MASASPSPAIAHLVAELGTDPSKLAAARQAAEELARDASATDASRVHLPTNAAESDNTAQWVHLAARLDKTRNSLRDVQDTLRALVPTEPTAAADAELVDATIAVRICCSFLQCMDS